MDWLPSDCVLLLILAASGFTYYYNCVSWVIFSVATIAASRWTNWCLCCCCVSLCGALFEGCVVWLVSAPIAPAWSISGAMPCRYGLVRKIITKRSGKSWRLYSNLQVKMERVTANLHLQFKLNPAAYSCTAYSCRGSWRSSDLQ